jgi:hypothetical protein
MMTVLANIQRMTIASEGKFDLTSYGGYNTSQVMLTRALNTFEVSIGGSRAPRRASPHANLLATGAQGLHQRLYLAVDGSLAAEDLLYTNNSIPVVDLVPGSYVDRGTWNATTRHVNLANLGLEFLAKARLINTMTPAEIAMTNQPVFWINQNSWTVRALLLGGGRGWGEVLPCPPPPLFITCWAQVGGLRDAMNASIMIAADRSSTQAAIVNQASLAVMVAGVALLLAVSLGVIVPGESWSAWS